MLYSFGKKIDNKFLNDKNNAHKFSEIFFKYAKQKPKTILKHFIKVNSIWWSPKEYYFAHNVVLSNDWIHEMNNGQFDTKPIWKFGNQKLIGLYNKTYNNRFLYTNIYRPAISIIVSFICIFAVEIKEWKNKRRGYILILLPMILNIGSCAFIFSSQDHRYFYTCHLTAYFSVLLFATFFINECKKNVIRLKSDDVILRNLEKNNKVSVIVPVYNAEDYLNRCVNSILNQTYRNIEIILVNDGSKDNSQKIIEEYKKQYSDIITAINQKNKGVSETRNESIRIANGKYIMFIDNDDFIEKDYIETYVREITSGNYDAVIGGYRRPNENGEIVKTLRLKDEEWCKYMIMTPWAKIFEKNFLIKNKIEFLKNNIGEDIFFNLKAMLISNKIKIVNYIGYNWFFNTKSVSNSKQKNIKNLQVFNLLDSCYDMLEKNNLIENNYEMIKTHFTRYIIWILSFSTKGFSYKEISEEHDKLFNWLKNKFPDYKKNKNIGLIKPKGEIFSVRFMMSIFMLFYKLHLSKFLVFVYDKLIVR